MVDYLTEVDNKMYKSPNNFATHYKNYMDKL